MYAWKTKPRVCKTDFPVYGHFGTVACGTADVERRTGSKAILAKHERTSSFDGMVFGSARVRACPPKYSALYFDPFKISFESDGGSRRWATEAPEMVNDAHDAGYTHFEFAYATAMRDRTVGPLFARWSSRARAVRRERSRQGRTGRCSEPTMRVTLRIHQCCRTIFSTGSTLDSSTSHIAFYRSSILYLVGFWNFDVKIV